MQSLAVKEELRKRTLSIKAGWLGMVKLLLDENTPRKGAVQPTRSILGAERLWHSGIGMQTRSEGRWRHRTVLVYLELFLKVTGNVTDCINHLKMASQGL